MADSCDKCAQDGMLYHLTTKGDRTLCDDCRDDETETVRMHVCRTETLESTVTIDVPKGLAGNELSDYIETTCDELDRWEWIGGDSEPDVIYSHRISDTETK